MTSDNSRQQTDKIFTQARALSQKSVHEAASQTFVQNVGLTSTTTTPSPTRKSDVVIINSGKLYCKTNVKFLTADQATLTTSLAMIDLQHRYVKETSSFTPSHNPACKRLLFLTLERLLSNLVMG